MINKDKKKDYKNTILENICYTELVYNRINKKLKLDLSKSQIEELILLTIKETSSPQFEKKGKNIYITNIERKIKLTINSNTNRIITADKVQ